MINKDTILQQSVHRHQGLQAKLGDPPRLGLVQSRPLASCRSLSSPPHHIHNVDLVGNVDVPGDDGVDRLLEVDVVCGD